MRQGANIGRRVAPRSVKTSKIGGKMISIMGLPRSGTTWLGKIFDSHPETFYSHEPDTASPFEDVPLFLTDELAQPRREELVRQVSALRFTRSLRVVGKLPTFPKSYRRLPVRAHDLGILALKSSARLVGEVPVPRWISGSPEDAPFWVWKSIESTGRLGAIARAFPDERFVFIIRHPCGVTASLLRGDTGTRFSAGPASEDYGFFERLAETPHARSRGLGIDEFRSMSATARVAWRWALLNEKALSGVRDLTNCRIVRYEDLCAEPMDTAKSLLDFCGIPWDVQSERFILQSTGRQESGYYSVFKNPMQSAFRWKKELPSPLVDEVMRTVSNTEPGRLY